MLGRRVTDSHERKAAIELQALRDDLAELGFTHKPETPKSPVVPVRNGFRTVRPLRSVVAGREDRPPRATRLSPVQRIAQVVESVRRWVFAHGHHEARKQPTPNEAEKQAAKVEPTEAVRQAEKISPVTSLTPRMHHHLKRRVSSPRHSRGIRH